MGSKNQLENQIFWRFEDFCFQNRRVKWIYGTVERGTELCSQANILTRITVKVTISGASFRKPAVQNGFRNYRTRDSNVDGIILFL